MMIRANTDHHEKGFLVATRPAAINRAPRKVGAE